MPNLAICKALDSMYINELRGFKKYYLPSLKEYCLFIKLTKYVIMFKTRHGVKTCVIASKTRHDVKKCVMTSKTRHDVKNA